MTDLGEQPSPEIEPAEPPPGGVDAVTDSLYEPAPLVPDLSQVGNEGDIPEEIAEPSDTTTAATRTPAGDDPTDQPDHEEAPA